MGNIAIFSRVRTQAIVGRGSRGSGGSRGRKIEDTLMLDRTVRALTEYRYKVPSSPAWRFTPVLLVRSRISSPPERHRGWAFERGDLTQIDVRFYSQSY